MVRTAGYAFALWLVIGTTGEPLPEAWVTSHEPETTTTTWTGWFSDKQCATSRVERGLIGPSNADCVKRCLDEGATPVFISEQAKAFFEVKDYAGVKDDLAYRIELTGIVDHEAKTVSVQSVKRLEKVGPMCARPKKSPEQP